MMNQIIITKGSGGYGGPLVIKPTDKKNKVMYIQNKDTYYKCSSLKPADHKGNIIESIHMLHIRKL